MGCSPGRQTTLASGVWSVLATPFRGPRLDVDEASLVREIEVVRCAGVTGLVVLGAFGEATSLDPDERAAVVRLASECAADLPVVVGLTSRSTAPAVHEACQAIAAAPRELAGLMVSVNTSDGAELADHLAAIHTATGASLVVQDYPAVSGAAISTRALAAAVEACPAVVAVKAEAAPTAPTVGALAVNTDVAVFGGLGGLGLVDELAAGAAGTMTGFSRPQALVAATRAWIQDGFTALCAAYAPSLPLVNFEAQLGIGLALRKESLRQQGVLEDAAVRPPTRALPAGMQSLVGNHLRALGVPTRL